MSDGIDIRKLSKIYPGSKTPALKDLTLQVKPGEVYGFLGANGAGKSTTIRLLLNFIQPSAGTAKISGKDIVKEYVEVKKRIGYLSGEVALWPKVTGHEIFEYLDKLRGQNSSKFTAELVKRFEAQPSKRMDELSKGNKQKIGLIASLMHQPEVLILDEPTSGLDPLMQEVFYDEIRQAASRGTAVFVSSHNLSEAQRMCDRIGIIKHGKLIHEQSLKDKELATHQLIVTVSNKADATKLSKHKGIKVVSSENNRLVLQPTSSLQKALLALTSVDVLSLHTEQLNLESEFLEYYGDSQESSL